MGTFRPRGRAAAVALALAAGAARASDPSLALTSLATTPPHTLAAMLAGCGVTVGDARYSGAGESVGMFTTTGVGSRIFGFNAGLVLSNGNYAAIQGPNTGERITTEAPSPGSDELKAIGTALQAPAGIQSGALLVFDFVPSATTVAVDYVLASSEYPWFVCLNYDVIGILLNGTNIATVPGSATTFVGITSVNDGDFSTSVTGAGATIYVFGSPCPGLAASNCGGICGSPYWINNWMDSATLSGDPVAATRYAGTHMNGMTTVMTAWGPVTPGVVNRLEFVTGGDLQDDTNLIIKLGSLRSGCTPPPWTAPPAPPPPVAPSATALTATAVALTLSPNPFRPGSGGPQGGPGVRIAPVGDGATVRIYTVRGLLVRTLAPSPGSGLVLWDGRNEGGRDAASGVYVVRIAEADGTRATRKVVVAR